MIISTSLKTRQDQFEQLLKNSLLSIQEDSTKRPKYFLDREGKKLEIDVYEAMKNNALGTIFENNIKLISGQKFPDIVTHIMKNDGYGVEIKTTKQNHWRTTGNSILENTRVDDVRRIYLFFGKLHSPIEFRFRKYEECLYDVAVTHSPRYLVDMNTPLNETIFDKISIPYDDLRKSPYPVKPIKEYYRKNLGPGEDVWWIDDDEVTTPSIIVRLWNNLLRTEKENLRNQALALFPEVFSKDNKNKYTQFATWLVAKHGVVPHALRDSFTAGGKEDITVHNVTYNRLPKIIKILQTNIPSIIEHLRALSNEDLSHYWKTPIKENRITQWISLVDSYTNQILGNSNLNIKIMIKEQLENINHINK